MGVAGRLMLISIIKIKYLVTNVTATFSARKIHKYQLLALLSREILR